MSTLFQKIISGKIPAHILFQDNLCIVIEDIAPQAPKHFLVIPKQVIPRVGEAKGNQKSILGHLLLIASEVAKTEGLDNGYRIVINNGPDGGETVPHMHVHVLGGRQMKWPPG